MTNLTIGDKLLDSCKDLLTMGVLSKAQYAKCVENIAGSDTRRKIKLTEKNIFSDARDDKEGKYNEFILSINRVIEETFKKYEDAKKANDEIEMRRFEAVIIQVVVLMNNVIDWVQNVSLKRHESKESGHYEELLFNYNKIDTNRKEIEKINKQMITLKERDVFQGEKRSSKQNNLKEAKNIFISLIVFIIIASVIIFLIYFI
jgi:hypothetical protein